MGFRLSCVLDIMQPVRPPTLQQPAEAWGGTLPGLDDDLERLQNSVSFLCTRSSPPPRRYVRLSNRKYDVTSKMGSAIMVDTHFRAALLYSGLDGSTSRFGSAEGSAGLGLWAA